MAAPETIPNFDERVHSEIWWKIKTGWTDAEYLDRKNAILTRLRTDWPDSLSRYELGGIADGIESLVATFDDSSWSRPQEENRGMVFAEQLKLYTKWARYIQSDSLCMSDFELYKMPCLSKRPTFPLLATNTNSLSIRAPQASQASQSSNNLVATVASTAISAQPPTLNIKQPFDWNNIEIHIYDKTGATDIRHHIPMVAVRPGNPDEPCHWYDFSFDKFLDHIYQHTSICYAQESDLLFWIDGKDWDRIRSSGDYKIMLKRFSKNANTRHILNLLVQRAHYGNFPMGFSSTPTLFEGGTN